MKEQERPNFRKLVDQKGLPISPSDLLQIAEGWELDYPEAGENNPKLKKQQNKEAEEPQMGQ